MDNRKFKNSLYNTPRWKAQRKWFLKTNTDCVLCGETASLVDHIVPHKGDEKLFWDVHNWQPMCRTCHDSVKKKMENGKEVKEISDNGSPTGEAWV